MVKKKGVPNYQNSILIASIEEHLPNGEVKWTNVANDYKTKSGEQDVRDVKSLKQQWKKLCNNFKKPTGKTGGAQDQILKCQKIQQRILEASNSKMYGLDSDDSDEDENEDDVDDGMIQNEQDEDGKNDEEDGEEEDKKEADEEEEVEDVSQVSSLKSISSTANHSKKDMNQSERTEPKKKIEAKDDGKTPKTKNARNQQRTSILSCFKDISSSMKSDTTISMHYDMMERNVRNLESELKEVRSDLKEYQREFKRYKDNNREKVKRLKKTVSKLNKRMKKIDVNTGKDSNLAKQQFDSSSSSSSSNSSDSS